MPRNRKIALSVLLAVTVTAAGVPLAAAVLRSHIRIVRSARAAMLGARLLGDDGVQLQQGARDCGPTALRAVLALRGLAVPQELRRPVMGRVGWSPEEIVAASGRAGLPASARKLPLRELANAEFPLIVLLGTHYVVIEERMSGGAMTVFDPDLGRLRVAADYLERDWTGHVVAFHPPSVLNLRSSGSAPERHFSAAGAMVPVNPHS